MRSRTSILLILACALASVPGIAGEWEGKEWDEIPDWAATLGLFVFGGPSASPVHLRLNDETVAEVAAGGTGNTYEILSALKTGPNVLSVEFLPADAPPEEASRLSVSLATSQVQSDGNRRLDEAIAETALPAAPPDAACTEEFRFWAGPPPSQPADELKKQYFLAVQGPPVGYLVTILINDQPLYTTTKGERFFEVTSFLKKGNNRVVFDAVPGCFPGTITAEGKLTIVIAAGRTTPDGFSWEGQLLGQFDAEHKKNLQPFTRRQSFRAR